MSFEHDCPTTKLQDSKMASQDWIAEKLRDWVKKNPGAGAKRAMDKLEGPTSRSKMPFVLRLNYI
jgi:hypothetical protein